MTWDSTPFNTDALGGKTVFPYEDWEQKTRPDLVKAPSGKELWHPVIVALKPDTNGSSADKTYTDAAMQIIELVKTHGGITASKDALQSLAILANPAGHEEYEKDTEILSHMVLYLTASEAKKAQGTSASPGGVYDTLHIGAAVPREILRMPEIGEDFAHQPIPKHATDKSQVLTAVIDDVIGIANQRFRAAKDENKTRIVRFWKQGLETFPTQDDVPEVVLGREYSKAEIDAALSGTATEASFYRKLYETQDWQRFLHLWGQIVGKLNDPEPGGVQILDSDFIEFIEFLERYGFELVDSTLRERADFSPIGLLEFNIEPLTSAYNFLARDYERPVGHLDAHGTAMLDIAAGFDLDSDLNDDRPIVAVELPSLATLETSGARLDAYVLQAVKRILYWADNHVTEDGKDPVRVPVVINLSYGITAGSKDGLGLLEDEIKRLVDHRNKKVPTVAVLPAGNTYRSLLNGAAAVKPGEAREVEWRVQPEDFSPSYLEMRVPNGSAFKLTFTAPGEAPFTKTVANLRQKSWVNNRASNNGLPSKAVYVTQEPGKGTERIVLALAPTTNLEQPRQLTQSGTYKVSIKNLGSDLLHVQYDVQRDDTPVGYPPLGRQSYLDDDLVDTIDPETKTRRFPHADSAVSFDETLNAFAGPQDSMMVLVGGTFADDNQQGVDDKDARQPAFYASSGVTPRKPDLSAISEQGRSLISGVLASGVFSSSVVAISGTSAAAPQATRAIVDFLYENQRTLPFTKEELVAGVLKAVGAKDRRKGAGTLGLEVATDRAGRLRRRWT